MPEASRFLMFMKEAYQEALYAVGSSDPNPAVGAVLVKNKKILGRGHTMPAGSDHAEVVAVRSAQKKYGRDITQGASLYVSLEPCSHHGRTPPCVELIIQSGISHVYIDQVDISQKVNGKGIKALRENGVQVIIPKKNYFCAEKMLTLEPFFKTKRKGRAYCILKWAQTKEGWLAPHSGASGRISSQTATEIVHRLRYIFRAALATPGTVLADQPKLNVRADWRPLEKKIKQKIKQKEMPNSPFMSLIRRDETVPKTLRKNHRYFILPAFWEEKDLTRLNARQSKIDPYFHLITYSRAQAEALKRQNIPHTYFARQNLFINSFELIHGHGHNQVMLEAGPKAAEFLVQKDLVDMLICLKSKRAAPFLNGVGFSLSKLLSREEGEDSLDKHGYKKILELNCGDDTVLVFSAK